jgi:hypothetical protein
MRVYEGEKLGRRITAMPPQISIPLDLPDVRVLQTEIDAKGDYIITVESTLERTQCRKCGREITQFHGHDERSVLVHSTISDVCIKEAIGYKAVVGAVNRHISMTVDWSRFTRIEVLGLDEIALQKGHDDFVVIVTAHGRNGQLYLLAVLADRTKETVKAFLRAIPERLKSQHFRFLCMQIAAPEVL